MRQVFTKQNRKLSSIGLVLASLFIAMVVLVALVGYNNSMRQRLIENSMVTLGEVTQQQAFNFYSHIESDIGDLKAYAYISNYLDISDEDFDFVLRNLALFSNFDFISVYALDGSGVDSEGNAINLNDYIDLSETYYSKTLVGNPIYFSSTEEPELPIITPIYNDFARVEGYLMGTYSLSELEGLILPSFSNNSYFYIVDSEGEIIMSTQSENALLDRGSTGNLLEFMGEAGRTESFDNLDIVAGKMLSEESGYFNITYGDESRYSYYMATGVNDWYIFSFVPEEDLLTTSEEITQSSLIFAFISFVVYLVLSTLILFLRRRDAIKQQRHANDLERIAYYDELTGLANYVLFKKQLQQTLKDFPNTSFALLKFDIEQFKMVNEILGVEMGDRVLKAIADISRDSMAQHKGKLLVARVGSDDFLVLSEAEITQPGKNRFSIMQDKVHNACGINTKYRLRFRYGRYVIPKGECNINAMLENVNLAHSLAKKNDRAHFDYDDTLKARLIHESEMENRMHQALQDGEFLVYIQPKYNLKKRYIQGAEALVRWQAKDGTLTSPGDFIPLFEKNGFITNLDYYMFEECCRLLAKWKSQGLAVVPISVNFSRIHLQNPSFASEVNAIAEKHDVPTSLLEIELTESIAMDNVELLEGVMWELHHFGFLLSMDDFGSGFSSLGLLKSLPWDVLKIDRSFFTTEANDFRAQVVVESVMRMAQNLDITTVAEGVEHKEQVDYLERIFCTMSQGYYFARPMPHEEFAKMLKKENDENH